MNDYIIHREDEEELEHHGILGMHWGIRRFQNEDGSLTPAGKQRYSTDGKSSGRTITNRVKSKLGIYKEGDDNPYVSAKRRKNRQIEEASNKVQKTLDQYEKDQNEYYKKNGKVNKDLQKEYSKKLEEDERDLKKETKDEDKKEAGYTLKNKVKSALGIYEEGDNNPYVSEKRREDRRRQQEEQKKQQAEENNKKAQKDIEKGQWYKTYNDATDKFNPLLSELNKHFGDEADIDNPKYMKAVGDLWNKTYSDEINRKYGSGVTAETIENFPLYNMYLAEIRIR